MGTEEDNKNAISQEHGEASTNAATSPAVVPNQEDTEIDQDKGASPLLAEAAKGNNKSKEKVDQNQTSSTSRASGKMVKDGSQPSDAGKEEYIHVRARRGQATNSHSLAERVRREKISERMKFLQELVPGCNKVTGKAVMLDEIINYVQSLQRQVEFLSMKLATVNPHLDLNNEVLLAKDILMAQGGPSAMGFSPDMSMVHAQQALLQGIPNMGNSLDTLRRTISSQLGLMGSGYKDLPQVTRKEFQGQDSACCSLLEFQRQSVVKHERNIKDMSSFI